MYTSILLRPSSFKHAWHPQVFQYISSLPVLHYLQVVLFIKIWTNENEHSLKSGGTKIHFRVNKSTLIEISEKLHSQNITILKMHENVSLLTPTKITESKRWDNMINFKSWSIIQPNMKAIRPTNCQSENLHQYAPIL
jgi:hypothetical protein